MTEACRSLLEKEWNKTTKPILQKLERLKKDAPLTSQEPGNIYKYQNCKMCDKYELCKEQEPDRKRWKICKMFERR